MFLSLARGIEVTDYQVAVKQYFLEQRLSFI